MIQEVKTRWNMTFHIENVSAAPGSHRLMDKNTMCLTAQEIDILKAAITILQPFEAITTEVSADKYMALIPLAKMLLSNHECVFRDT